MPRGRDTSRDPIRRGPTRESMSRVSRAPGPHPVSPRVAAAIQGEARRREYLTDQAPVDPVGDLTHIPSEHHPNVVGEAMEHNLREVRSLMRPVNMGNEHLKRGDVVIPAGRPMTDSVPISAYGMTLGEYMYRTKDIGNRAPGGHFSVNPFMTGAPSPSRKADESEAILDTDVYRAAKNDNK